MAAQVDAETFARANALKDEGNTWLSRGKCTLAAEKYTEAIALHPTAIFYSNRAQALIKMESFGLAIEDANHALKLDPNYIKAYYRRGSAHYALGQLKQALKDFKAVISIVPNDQDAMRKYKTCEKDIRAEAFQKAIEFDAPVTDITKIWHEIDSMAVSDSYEGPRLSFLPEATLQSIISDKEERVSSKINRDTESTPLLSVDFVHEVMETFKMQKLLHKKYVMQVLFKAHEYFKRQPTLLRLQLPRSQKQQEHEQEEEEQQRHDNVVGSFTVCGDTHGQFFDLCNIFALNGEPRHDNAYLFNGDFVDRGSFSFETVFTLLCWKLALPNSLFLLRGNHETKNMNKIYGFHGEVKHKYDDKVMDLFAHLFTALPLAATIENKVFVVHGGLSTEQGGAVSLHQINGIDRFREPPQAGLMSDLMWADPQAAVGLSPSKRGLGFSFGPDYTKSFLDANNLKLLIRSHEVRDEGYEIEQGGQCITIFSAPNYCDQMGNKGAMIRFENSEEMKPAFIQFEAVPHPDVPPMRYASNMFAL